MAASRVAVLGSGWDGCRDVVVGVLGDDVNGADRVDYLTVSEATVWREAWASGMGCRSPAFLVVLAGSFRCVRRLRQAQPGGVGGRHARVGASSLASTAETRWSTVFADEQFRGDLGVGLPGADQAENVALTRGQPERVRPVASRGPAGIDRMPSWRIFCRVSRAVAVAPRL